MAPQSRLMNTKVEIRKTIKVIENYYGAHPFVVAPNDIYEFMGPCITRTKQLNPVGTLLFVIKSTKDTPYGEISASGHNWICSTQFGISCWATLENCISRGILRKTK